MVWLIGRRELLATRTAHMPGFTGDIRNVSFADTLHQSGDVLKILLHEFILLRGNLPLHSPTFKHSFHVAVVVPPLVFNFGRELLQKIL